MSIPDKGTLRRSSAGHRRKRLTEARADSETLLCRSQVQSRPCHPQRLKLLEYQIASKIDIR